MKKLPAAQLTLSGRVATGRGQGADFTRLDWARAQFLRHSGIEPFPGTLNLLLEAPIDHDAWRALRRRSGHRVRAPIADGCDAPAACDARLYPVRIADAVSGAVVVPEVDGYPPDQVEIIAAVDLRAHLGVVDGDTVRVAEPDTPAPQAVIFDVDGTLLNSLDGYCLAAGRATEPYGWRVSIDDVRRALDANQPFWNFVIPPDREPDAHLIAELRDATMRHWPGALTEVVAVLPGCAAALHRLRQAGMRLAIFTGSGGESFPPLRAAGLLDLFEVVVTGNDVAGRKPAPDGLHLCLERLGLAPEQAVYVGDASIDVAAGRAAGMAAIAVLTGAGNSASLTAAGAHRITPSVAHLPEIWLP